MKKKQRDRMEETKRRWSSDPAYNLFDYSEDAFLVCDEWESRGGPEPPKENGYAYAKRMMDVTYAMWKEDIRDGYLTIQELIDDGYKESFLDSLGLYTVKFKENKECLEAAS